MKITIKKLLARLRCWIFGHKWIKVKVSEIGMGLGFPFSLVSAVSNFSAFESWICTRCGEDRLVIILPPEHQNCRCGIAELNDEENWVNEKVLAALKVPKAYLGFEDGKKEKLPNN